MYVVAKANVVFGAIVAGIVMGKPQLDAQPYDAEQSRFQPGDLAQNEAILPSSCGPRNRGAGAVQNEDADEK